MQNLSNKIDGNSIGAIEWNQIPAEIQNLITQAGIALSSGDLQQLGQAIAALGMGNSYYTDSGSANVYQVNPVSGRQGASILVDGMFVMFRPNNANTGASTLEVNSLDSVVAKAIRRENGAVLSPNDVVADRDVICRYDSGADQFFLLQAALLDDVVTGLPKGFLSGFVHSNGTDSDHDIDVSGVGECRDDADTMNIAAIALTKQIDVTWGEGTDDGGYPDSIAALAAGWYRFFAVATPDGSSVDYGWDLEANEDASGLLADTVLAAAGYTKFRQIGWHLIDSGPDIVAYVQNVEFPSLIDWDVPLVDVDNIATVASQVAQTLSGPPGSVAEISVSWTVAGGASAPIYALLLPVGLTDTTPTSTLFNFSGARQASNVARGHSNMNIALDSSSQMNVRWDQVLGTYSLITFGYLYQRGTA